jgi:hypothetical protein
MDNVISLTSRKKIKALTENIRDLEEINKILKATINSLTNYDKYASIKRRLDDLFILYQDTKRAIDSKKEILQRLKNEQT